MYVCVLVPFELWKGYKVRRGDVLYVPPHIGKAMIAECVVVSGGTLPSKRRDSRAMLLPTW